MLCRYSAVLFLSFFIFCQKSIGESVPSSYKKIALENGVPSKILYAVAMVESRKTHNGKLKPWPWTLNVSDRAYRFDTKEQAESFLNREVKSGNENIAIGIMQIYWRYHKKRYDSPVELLDPWENVSYGAEYLRILRNQSESWAEAVGYYYTGPNPETDELRLKSKKYAIKVVKEWEKLF